MPLLARRLLAGFLLLMAASVTSQQGQSLALSSGKIEFPAQSVGTSSPPQSLTLTNPGTASIDLRGIQISGIDFSQSNNCPEKLPASAKCSIEITFQPAVAGNRLGALQLSWSGAGSPRTIPLTGLGE